MGWRVKTNDEIVSIHHRLHEVKKIISAKRKGERTKSLESLFVSRRWSLTNPNEFRNVSSPSPMFCSAYVSATRSANPPPFDSMRNPTKIVDSIEPNMMNRPPANTVRNSLSGMFAMSESMVAIISGDMSMVGSQRFSDVVDLATVVLVVLVAGVDIVRRRCGIPADDDCDGMNDATRSPDDARTNAANSAGVDLFIVWFDANVFSSLLSLPI